MPTATPIAHSASRPPAQPRPAIDQFVAALARAVHRFRAYPQDSPLCVDAVEAAHRALLAIDHEQIVLRIIPRAVLADDQPVAEAPAIADMRMRLQQMGVGTIGVARGVSVRDLGRLCRELVAHEAGASEARLPETLAAIGVQHVDVSLIVRPAVLGGEDVPAERLASVDRTERMRSERPGPAAGRLCPPEKGWIRLDPGLPVPAQVSLTGLAQLIADPVALAEMLVSLTDHPPFEDAADALQEKFELVSALFRSVDPALAAPLFARLARSVLELPDARRRALLRETVLPGLLDGRIDGSMLRHFPDEALVETLALVLDEPAGGRKLTSLALDRLDVDLERRAGLESRLAVRLASYHAAARAATDGPIGPGQIVGYDGGRINVDLTAPKEFRDFEAFDLAIDEEAEIALDSARDIIRATSTDGERLRCLVHLLALETNVDSATRLLAAVTLLLTALAERSDRQQLAQWVQRLRQTAAAVSVERVDVAALIVAALARQFDERLLGDMLELGPTENQRHAEAVAMLEALGAAAAPALIDLLEHEQVRSRRHALVKMMCACAPALAPALAARFPHPHRFVTRNLATVLGHAGPGYEATLASAVTHSDIRVVREALRGLAHIGTPAALDVVRQSLGSRDQVAAIAEEVFWSFAGAREAARALIADRAFVSRHATLARRLLVRAARTKRADLQSVIGPLRRFRFHIWRPSHVRLGFAAAGLEGR